MRSTLLLTTAACLALGAFAANPPAARAQDEMMMPDDPSMDMPAGPADDGGPMVKPRKHRNPDAAQSGTETPQRPKRDLKNAGGEPRRDDARKAQQSQSELPKPEPRNAADTAKQARQPQPQPGDAAKQAEAPKPTDNKAAESAKPADAAKSADTQAPRKLNNTATETSQAPAPTERRDQPRNAADAQGGSNATATGTTADTTRQTDTTRLNANANAQGDGAARSSLSISTDAAPRIQRSLRDRGNRSDVSIDVAIGRQVPDRVRLAPLPPDIVDMSPELRGYDYVVVDDDVVVVDPRSRDVVEVIQSDGSTASRGASRIRSAETTTTSRRSDETGTVSSSQGNAGSVHLTLSADQRTFVRDEILKLRDAAMLNIMTGEQLPDRVPTQPIPRNVADQVPDLGSLDYFVSNERIVIVDPQSHGIVDVIQ